MSYKTVFNEDKESWEKVSLDKRWIRNKKTGEIREQHRTGYDVESESYPFFTIK